MQIKLSELRRIIREELSRKYPAPSDAIKTELRHDGTGMLMNHSDVMHKFLSGDVMGIRVEDSNSEIGKGWTNDAVDYLKQVAEINPEHAPTREFLRKYSVQQEDEE